MTVEDVRQLMGASTPHFALQLRERIRTLIRGLPAGHPARVEGEREIARLDRIAFAGEIRGHAGRAGADAAAQPRPRPRRRPLTIGLARRAGARPAASNLIPHPSRVATLTQRDE